MARVGCDVEVEAQVRTVLHHILYGVIRRYNRLRWSLRRLSGRVGPVQILPYIGYGTRDVVFVSGRAVANRRVQDPQPTDSVWRNIVNMVRRFNTQPIPDTPVSVRIGALEQVVTTNARGRFFARLECADSLPDGTVWHTVALTLSAYPDHPGAHATSKVLVPAPRARFGVISDLDDTVIETNVISKIRTVLNTFTQNAHTRMTFPGVAAFYRALHAGTGDAQNPLFYISMSPNVLYDMLLAFFRLRGIPPGPMFLINMGMTETHFFRPNHRRHKEHYIHHIMDTYANLPFVLIGDSGEDDAEIYLDIVQRYPGRVKAIYIRDVLRGRRGKTIRALSAAARQCGVDLLLTRDTLAAAQHAAAHGVITPESVAAVRAEIAAAR